MKQFSNGGEKKNEAGVCWRHVLKINNITIDHSSHVNCIKVSLFHIYVTAIINGGKF